MQFYYFLGEVAMGLHNEPEPKLSFWGWWITNVSPALISGNNEVSQIFMIQPTRGV